MTENTTSIPAISETRQTTHGVDEYPAIETEFEDGTIIRFFAQAGSRKYQCIMSPTARTEAWSQGPIGDSSPEDAIANDMEFMLDEMAGYDSAEELPYEELRRAFGAE
jgi:hypothetical protein